MSLPSGHSANLEEIPITAFMNNVKEHLEKLLNTYGHKECGVQHIELCSELNNFITKEKQTQLQKKHQSIKTKFNSLWSTEKKNFFDKTFKEFGFPNVCFPRQSNSDQELYDLKAMYIKFCISKEGRLTEAKLKNDYNTCVQYNKWIEQEKGKFQRTYLKNVKRLNSEPVIKYLRPVKHKGSFQPLNMHNRHKLDCDEIAKKQKEQQKIQDPGFSITPHRTGETKPKPGQTTQHYHSKPKTETKHGKDSKVREPSTPKSSADSTQISTPVTIQRNNPTTHQDSLTPSGDVKPTSDTSMLPKESTSTKTLPATPEIQHKPAPNLPIPLQPGPPTHQQQSPHPRPSKPEGQTPTTGVHIPTAESPDVNQEQAPNKGLTGAESNKNIVRIIPKLPGITLHGTPVTLTTTVFEPAPDFEDSKFKTLYNSDHNNLDGQKIPENLRYSFGKKPTKTFKHYPNYVQGEPITDTKTKSYNFIPPEILRSDRLRQLFLSQRFHSLLSSQGFIPPHPRSQQFPASIPRSQQFPVPISNLQSSVTTIPSVVIKQPLKSTQKSEIVLIDPATPDPSLFRSPFMIYTLIFLTLFTIITTLFLLFKYTPFGLLFSKKKKKKRLKRQLKIKKISEESPHFNKINNYLASNIPYENKADTDKKIYNQIKIQKFIIEKNKRLKKIKKNKQKTLIDIHMELLNEFKSDEWEMNKNDFLEICLEEFIRAQNERYANLEKNQLIKKNISIQNTKEEKIVLWDKWAERYRPIWENFKRENMFKVLQNKWKDEEKAYLENVEAEDNILNENQKISLIEVKKVIWKMWIAKQAKLIEQYKEESWIRSLVEKLDSVSDEYKNVKDGDDLFLIHIADVEHKENKGEMHTQDNETFLMKSLIQVLMMIIEECIKQESAGKREVVLDTLIGKFNKKKNTKNKLENVENLYAEITNRMKHNKHMEQSKHKNEDNLKDIMEGWIGE
ncbi:STP1 protein [Plasmodium ovale wallikeri]|uniref:STP1 protein n=1 Tax=Plasmodium ovale wallikeri TaxID=864142 RepID=A0A1A9AHS8_PLAOA|nr:STP1 protein [Plasmodium ovale wallikeri]SBT58867.1 STP1 protein [Plasmodium ovale wallikeri]